MTSALDILQSRKAMKILALFTAGTAEHSQSDVSRNAKVSRATALKWLKSMHKAGFLRTRRLGNAILYSSEENPVVKQLKVLINVSMLYEAASEMKGKYEIYLFGSASRGEDIARSDIDILFIGKINSREIAAWASGASRKVGKEINVIAKTPLEYSNLIRKDRIFYENAERNKIRIV